LRLFIGTVLLLMFGSASAASYMPDGNWHYFWNEIKQDVYDPYDPKEPPIGHEYRYRMDFSYTSTGAFQFDITDAWEVGDRYQVFVNDQLLLTTSETDPNFFGWDAPYQSIPYVDEWDGDIVWADNFLSDGSLVLNAGTYDFRIEVLGATPQIGSSGFFRATSIVPIPAAVWLFGSALAGLGWMRRKQTAIV